MFFEKIAYGIPVYNDCESILILTFFAADHEYGIILDNDALNICIYAILCLEVRNGFNFLQEQYLIVIQRDVSCIKIQDQVQG